MRGGEKDWLTPGSNSGSVTDLQGIHTEPWLQVKASLPTPSQISYAEESTGNTLQRWVESKPKGWGW